MCEQLYHGESRRTTLRMARECRRLRARSGRSRPMRRFSKAGPMPTRRFRRPWGDSCRSLWPPHIAETCQSRPPASSSLAARDLSEYSLGEVIPGQRDGLKNFTVAANLERRVSVRESHVHRHLGQRAVFIRGKGGRCPDNSADTTSPRAAPRSNWRASVRK